MPANAVPVDEQQRRAQYMATPVLVDGFVIDMAGEPVAGALVELAFLPDAIRVASATSDEAGHYRLPNIQRRNAQVQVRASDFRDEIIYLQLAVPLSQNQVRAEPVVLSASDASVQRMLFGGDLTWGRRLLGLSGTVSEQTTITNTGVFPPDDLRSAVIDINNPASGTEATIKLIKPYFDLADFRSVVLHSPSLSVSEVSPPADRHPVREFAYFSMSESLPTLNSLGVDYVALGNDHIYDYLETGIDHTLDQLDSLGLPFSGAASAARALAAAELVEDQAYLSHRAANGYSFMSFTSLGFNASPSYVANDLSGKGGAAYAGSSASPVNYRDKYRGAVADEVQMLGNDTIVQLHMGFSNSAEPSNLLLTRSRQAIESGAALALGHHAHVPHGFEYIERATPGLPPGLVAHSLGNLIYDQSRLETAVGLLAQVDMQGGAVSQARAVPIYLKGFIPRPAVGDLADAALGRVAELSTGGLPLSAGHAWLSQLNSAAWVLADDASLDPGLNAPVVLELPLGSDGSATIDLRDLPGAPSLLELDPALTVKSGSDLLRFGHFEDVDVDDETFDLEQWSTDDQDRFACLDQVYRGAFSVCLDTTSTGSEQTIVNRNPVRVPVMFISGQDPVPQTDLTVMGYVRGDAAGPLSVRAAFRASRTRECASSVFQFGEQQIYTAPASSNSFGWTAFEQPIAWPDDPSPQTPQVINGDCDGEMLEYDWEFDTPRALRLEITQQPGSAALGRAAFDDIAVIQWTPLVNNGAISLPTPNATQFVEISGPANTTVLISVTTADPKPMIAVGLSRSDFLFSDGFE